MFGMGPAGGVADRRIVESQRPCPPRRFRGEGFFSAEQAFGYEDAGIVARLHDDAADEIFDLHPAVHLDEHLRAAHAPRLLADEKLVVHAELGSASITATAEGIDSFPTTIVVAQPVEGAVLIADEQIIAPPTAVDGEGGDPRLMVTLSGPNSLALGDVIIGSGAASIGGQVESVVQSPDGLEVVYTPLPPHDLFEKLSLDLDIDLSAAPAVPVSSQDNAQGLARDPDRSADRVTELAEKKKICDGEATLITISGMNTTFENDLKYHLHLQDGVVDPEPTTLYVDGNITQKVSGGVSVKAGFTGTYTCKGTLFRIPIPIAGVASLVARPVVPIGVAFSGSGSVTGAAVTVNIEQSIGLDLKAGFTYDAVDGLTLYHDFKPKPESPKLTFDLVTPSTYRIGASIFGGLASGVDVTIAGIEDVNSVGNRVSIWLPPKRRPPVTPTRRVTTCHQWRQSVWEPILASS